jgi:hypothetical protein
MMFFCDDTPTRPPAASADAASSPANQPPPPPPVRSAHSADEAECLEMRSEASQHDLGRARLADEVLGNRLRYGDYVCFSQRADAPEHNNRFRPKREGASSVAREANHLFGSLNQLRGVGAHRHHDERRLDAYVSLLRRLVGSRALREVPLCIESSRFAASSCRLACVT